jgi:cysteine desulfurase
LGRHYLDHASTSPARPEVVEAMVAWLAGEASADPGRVHTPGRMARAAIEQARSQVAALLNAKPRQVVFTSGATEAANAAVWGATRQHPGRPVVCAAVEHSCVREASWRLAPVLEVPVDGQGRVVVAAVEELLARQPPPALVHCQLANHEVGTLQPAAEVAALCRERGVLCHVDAAAAVGHVALDVADLGADLVSVSAHKMGGPKGVGALVIRPGLRLEPLIVGGSQERARRAGLENTPAIVGFGVAAHVLSRPGALEAEARRAADQTSQVLALARSMDGASVLGDPVGRLPHIVCLGLEGVVAEGVLLGLDQRGVYAHSGSACSSESLEPSPVLAAMGQAADQSLRISVGWSTTEADIAALTAALPEVVDSLRALGRREASRG